MASESALEILTDILDDFNNKFCNLLRMGVDNQALNGRTGFPVSELCGQFQQPRSFICFA